MTESKQQFNNLPDCEPERLARAPRWFKDEQKKPEPVLVAELPSGAKIAVATAEKWIKAMKLSAIRSETADKRVC